MSELRTFHAIVLVDGTGDVSRRAGSVAGLSLCERAVRVAHRAGAANVTIVRSADDRRRLGADWQASRASAVLVVRASDQVVHVPLVKPLIEAGVTALAVAPADAIAADLAAGDYAGALLAVGIDADAVVAALAAGDDDGAIAARLRPRAAAVPHGEIARHPARTRDERRAAARMLYRIIHKPQDNALTRYLYRPVSFPLTRLFLRTPITPNQISYLTAVLVLLGLWLTARGSVGEAITGTAVVLIASYVDCCDGEVARLKLLSSRFGAWLDTVIDELASLGYMVALGVHCQRHYGRDYFGHFATDPWIAATWVGIVTYALAIYFVYYNIIVVVGSANSQDYVGRFEVVPGAAPNTVRLRPAATQPIAPRRELHPVLKWIATYAPYGIRRDFISWATLAMAIARITHVAFIGLVVGGAVSAVVLSIDHVRLLRQRRAIQRSGQVLVLE